MEKIKDRVIDGIEWLAALSLVTVIILALMVSPGIIEVLIK